MSPFYCLHLTNDQRLSPRAARGFPCCVRFPYVHAVATTPAQRLGACFAHFPSPISLPRSRSRVGLRIVLFEACSAFTRVTACTLARSPIRDSLHQRLQPFRYLHSCSGCFRLERLPGGTLTHWESAALPRRTLEADIQIRIDRVISDDILKLGWTITGRPTSRLVSVISRVPAA